MSVSFITTITITCTDRGQHPLTTLGELSIFDDGSLGSVHANQVQILTARAERRKSESVWLDMLDSAPLRLNMRCPRCGRHIEWAYVKARDRLKRMKHAGISTVDISHWPSHLR